MDKIFTILEGIPFGKQYFEVGILLRSCLLVSSMIFNSEAWYNLTEAELNLLETIDLIFLQAPKGHQKRCFSWKQDLGDMSMEEISKLKKGFFMQKVKRTIKDQLFEKTK